MIARLAIKLPFAVLLPEGENFTLHAYEQDGYLVRVELPVRDAAIAPVPEGNSILLNGKPAFYADIFVATFQREDFHREVAAPIDPPVEVVERVVNSFISRLKYVAKAPQVREVALHECSWNLEYFNDDNSEIVPTEGLCRGRLGRVFGLSYIACDSALWEIIEALPPDFEPPVWRTLLTDAFGALPHIGSAITLGATALEVFISQALNGLQKKSSVPDDAWSWLNGRSNRQNDPTVEEQFSSLLSILSGRSLKKDAPDLWERFKNLKQARNSFVHSGSAQIGGRLVDQNEAASLLQAAEQIILRIREWLPPELHWPIKDHVVALEWTQMLLAPSVEPDSNP